MNRKDVAALLAKNGVIAVKADKTHNPPDVIQLLQELGNSAAGIPFLAVYPGSGGDAITLDGPITQQQVLDALEKAGPSGERKPTGPNRGTAAVPTQMSGWCHPHVTIACRKWEAVRADDWLTVGGKARVQWTSTLLIHGHRPVRLPSGLSRRSHNWSLPSDHPPVRLPSGYPGGPNWSLPTGHATFGRVDVPLLGTPSRPHPLFGWRLSWTPASASNFAPSTVATSVLSPSAEPDGTNGLCQLQGRVFIAPGWVASPVHHLAPHSDQTTWPLPSTTSPICQLSAAGL